MNIKRNGSQPSETAPAEYFTGHVRIDYRFNAPDPARVGGPVSPLNQGAAPPGTPIRWARP